MATSSSNLHGEYKPSRALAIVVCVIFIVLSLVQIWRIIRTQRWFGFTIVIGGLFEIAGLAARMYSCTHRNDQDSYGAQIILIILAPNFFAASIYTLLGRLIETTTTSERVVQILLIFSYKRVLSPTTISHSPQHQTIHHPHPSTSCIVLFTPLLLFLMSLQKSRGRKAKNAHELVSRALLNGLSLDPSQLDPHAVRRPLRYRTIKRYDRKLEL